MLAEGDTVKLFLADETIEKFSEIKVQKIQKEKKVQLSILYEDEDILLINKPAGMLSQKARDTDLSLVEYLTDYLMEKGSVTEGSLRSFKPSVCNRLDRNTSGIVAGGKSLAGSQMLSEVFRDRTVPQILLLTTPQPAAASGDFLPMRRLISACLCRPFQFPLP